MSEKTTTNNTEATEQQKLELAEAFARTASLLGFKSNTPEYKDLLISMGIRYGARESEISILAEAQKLAFANHRPWHTPARTLWDISTGVVTNLLTIGVLAGGAALVSVATAKKEDEVVVETENDVFSNPTTSKFQPLKTAK